MPDEPLIFVEVALVKGLADSVQGLLDRHAPLLNPAQADTAIFYSISNCQRGLAGISFGNFLIKRVVDLLSAEFANVRHFATLSPVPGFRRWLEAKLAEDAPGLVSDEESAGLRAAAPAAAGSGTAALAAVLAQPRFFRNAAMLKAAGPVLERLCARYLMTESRGKRAADPVAHFHLSNGARIERIRMGADTSEKGEKESATLMVNYLYDPARIEAYHEEYAGEGRRNASSVVRRLSRGGN
jgi:malonyl-CoA decarboxylase